MCDRHRPFLCHSHKIIFTSLLLLLLLLNPLAIIKRPIKSITTQIVAQLVLVLAHTALHVNLQGRVHLLLVRQSVASARCVHVLGIRVIELTLTQLAVEGQDLALQFRLNVLLADGLNINQILLIHLLTVVCLISLGYVFNFLEKCKKSVAGQRGVKKV